MWGFYVTSTNSATAQSINGGTLAVNSGNWSNVGTLLVNAGSLFTADS